ncbi:hypothetical protein [Belliella aquatica]|uniref:XRE family transcriptional regulator n=1 Tax=Belliella aquatica TaxID=1323734 RepID=A0ABQ1MAF7_9BACT|nr:hypothetical protein [Belliella aquatica]MCH7406230.1 hypothetical protein [Belliella aquatica]GGC37186.1 hypothetical protein GCM10010993_15020 [Belliella aquatica]
MSGIIDRIGEFASNQKLSIRKIEQKIGAGNGTISKAIGKDKDIQAKWIELFASHYPNVNPVWLLRGEGNMLLTSNQQKSEEPFLRAGEPVHGFLPREQHLEIVDSLKQVISALEGQLDEKERIIVLKDRIIRELEERL